MATEYKGYYHQKEKNGKKFWVAQLRYKDNRGKWNGKTKKFGADVVSENDAFTAYRKWRDEVVAAEEQQKHDEQEREEQQRKEQQQQLSAKQAVSVADYCLRYLSEEPISGATLRGYKVDAQHIAAAFDGVSIADLDADKVKVWLKDTVENERFAKSTRTKDYRFLTMVCDKAMDEGYLIANPCQQAKRYRQQLERANARDNATVKAKANRLTAASKKKLEACLDDGANVLQCGAALALYCGLRAGEACGLRWSDVDLEQGELHVTHTIQRTADKGNIAVKMHDGSINYNAKVSERDGLPKSKSSERTILLPEVVKPLLAARRAAMQADCLAAGIPASGSDLEALYVLGRVDGNFKSPNALSRDWHCFAVGLGIKTTSGQTARFHDLRHEYGSTLGDANIDESSLMAAMGHSSRAMVDRYVHPCEDAQLKVKAALDSLDHPTAKAPEVLPLRMAQ